VNLNHGDHVQGGHGGDSAASDSYPSDANHDVASVQVYNMCVMLTTYMINGRTQ